MCVIQKKYGLIWQYELLELLYVLVSLYKIIAVFYSWLYKKCAPDCSVSAAKLVTKRTKKMTKAHDMTYFGFSALQESYYLFHKF